MRHGKFGSIPSAIEDCLTNSKIDNNHFYKRLAAATAATIAGLIVVLSRPDQPQRW